MALWCNPLALKSEQSCGVCSIHDRIPPLERPLMVFNFSLRKGIFPDVWELARVTPIFKSGSKSEANNYRRISVISGSQGFSKYWCMIKSVNTSRQVSF